MNKSVVKITANAQGLVVVPSTNNPSFGYVRVEQESATFEGGWMRRHTKSALISGSIEDLKSAGFFKGQELPGQIVVSESLEPFNKENPDRDLKFAGNTGVVCTYEGKPIYRRAEFTSDLEATDSLIIHDNTEEIKQAQLGMKATAEKVDAPANLGE